MSECSFVSVCNVMTVFAIFIYTYIDFYTYIGFLLRGAHLYLCNLSLTDSEIRYYTSLNRKQAENIVTHGETSNNMHGMLFLICTCYQSPTDNQDLARDIQSDKLQVHKTITGV